MLHIPVIFIIVTILMATCTSIEVPEFQIEEISNAETNRILAPSSKYVDTWNEEWEELYEPLIHSGKGVELSRVARQALTEGCGQDVIDIVITLVAPSTALSDTDQTRNEIVQKVRSHLKSNNALPDLEDVSVVTMESITNEPLKVRVEMDLRFEEDEISNVTENTLATKLRDMKSLTIGSQEVDLENKVLINLPVECYFCSSSQRCIYSDENIFVACVVFDSKFFAYGPQINDSTTLAKDSENAFAEVLMEGFPFIDQSFNKLFISVNGLISVGTPYTSYSPSSLVNISRRLIAPYWSDLHLSSNDTVSNVYYKLYLKSNTEDRAMINEVADRLGTNADLREVLIVTWDNVPAFSVSGATEERVTFQCVLATNRLVSFAIFMYANGGMGFNPDNDRSVHVGYTDNELAFRNQYYNFDREIGNSNEIGEWHFTLPILQTVNYEAQCSNWAEDNAEYLSQITANNAQLPDCFCLKFIADLSSVWIQAPDEPNCYDILPLYQYGTRCCYASNGYFASTIPEAGSYQRYSYLGGDLVNNQLQDKDPKRWCCEESDMCSTYYTYRPASTCSITLTILALLFGDPHIQTLDGRQYTFNGLGDYTILEAPYSLLGVDYTYVMQGRTCKAITEEGKESDATIWCAFAIATGKANITVELDPNNNSTHMVIYANGVDISVAFQADSFEQSVPGLVLGKKDGSLTFQADIGIGGSITLGLRLLDFSIQLPELFFGKTKGLLGNANKDSTDDFISPNGTQFSNGMSDREIFEYGSLWAVKEADSVFRYPSGKNSSSFTPLFLDEQDENLLQNATDICGDNNIPCIYDFFATGNKDLALETKTTEEVFVENEKILTNTAPVLEGKIRKEVVLNEEFTVTLTATDADEEDDKLQFVTLEIPPGVTPNINDNVWSMSYTPNNADEFSIVVAANDSNGVLSQSIKIFIVFCSGCSGEGECDFNATASNSSNPYFVTAPCNCNEEYSGADCELDKDGCDIGPCPTGTTCTDVLAANEKTTNKKYACSNCQAGFILNDDESKCVDVDECDENSNICGAHATCANIVGSYTCTCLSGYRKNTQDACTDIDECTENTHNCAQICTNTVGSFNCSCEEGFAFKEMGDKDLCIVDTASDPCANETLKCDYGCRVVDGNAECFCQNGYQPLANGACVDINECEQKYCAQDCENSIGSYRCFCFSGYRLSDDKQDCIKCQEGSYGEDCSQSCSCLGRASACDHVTGCVCEPEWKGTSCEIDVNECLTPNKCPPEQICTNTDGGFTCTCPTGYQNLYQNGSCYDIDECAQPADNKCPDKCVNNPGSFSCLCSDGYNYIKEKNACEDINECTSGLSGCTHICDNQIGSYNCECYEGNVLLPDRKTCAEITDPCAAFNDTCSFGCIVENDKPMCYCQAGFELANDLSSCIDVNECEDDTLNKCELPENCVNTAGSFQCSCPIGKELQNDGISCKDCDDFHWGENCETMCSCDPLGSRECSKTLGCQCKDGYAGEFCENEIDECSTGIANCPENSKCVNLPGSYLCDCSTGYTLNGTECIDINECDNSPCDQTCENSVGSYTCICRQGFKRSSENKNKCEDVNECELASLNTCEQNCRNTNGYYSCSCFENYFLNTTTRTTCIPTASAICSVNNTCSHSCGIIDGVETCFCSKGYELDNDNVTCIDIKECATEPCIEGMCQELPGEFACSCSRGFQLEQDSVTCSECAFDKYGDNCAETCTCDFTKTTSCNNVDGTCTCSSGWQGKNCTEDRNECIDDSVQCPALSSCKNRDGDYICECQIGYILTDGKCIECDSSHYGVNCVQTCTCEPTNTKDCDNTNGNCTCNEGWQGDDCKINVDECSLNSSLCSDNTEKCTDKPGSYVCECIDGYARPNPGESCQDLDECKLDSLNNCIDPRECKNYVGNYNCVCKEGYSDAISDECVDIDECENDPCVNANCTNNEGSFACTCLSGYQGSGTTCTDINECDVGTHTCIAPRVCVNNEASFECVCDRGYEEINQTCIEKIYYLNIEATLNYTSTADLLDNSTQEYLEFTTQVINAFSSTAETAIGNSFLSGQVTDVRNGSVIVAMKFSISLLQTSTEISDAARIGVATANLTSIEIDGNPVTVEELKVLHTDPSNSANSILTSIQNKDICAIFSLLAPCTVGKECSEINDVAQCTKIPNFNECQVESLNTCTLPRVCNDTVEGFDCVCGSGYREENSVCLEETFEVNTEVTLGYTANDAQIFDSSTQAFRNFAAGAVDDLTAAGTEAVSTALFSVTIISARSGSVILSTQYKINRQVSSNPISDASKVASSWANLKTVDVNGQTLPVENVKVQVTDPDNPTQKIFKSVLSKDQCSVFVELSPCSSGKECKANTDGILQCVDKDDDDTSYELIIGLGVGIPLFVLLLIVIAIIVYLYARRQRNKASGRASDTPSIHRDDQFPSIFATKVATRGAFGQPTRFYSPDGFSEAATSESGSGDGRLLTGRSKGRLDFQDSPWNDTQGRDYTSQGGATATDFGQPTSNFSWEYMFGLLEPYKGFEIQRPNLKSQPNSVYNPHSNV